MKVNKIISIAVINGLTLLIFASLLASCQKNSIHSKGHFSTFDSSDLGRTIASTKSEHLQSLQKHFDLKQVYIYCSLNDIHVEKCYQDNVKTIIHRYEQKIGKFSPEEIKAITGQILFQETKKETGQIVHLIIQKMETHIGQLVHKRENFCKVNSKFYIERCLKQYVNTDTMSVLNTYQQHYPKLNGQEYLFLKQAIEKNFLAKLDASFKKLQSEEKKS